MSDGLSSNKVNSIYKDSRGYIWIGTKNGLNRYDGHRFRQYFSDYDPKNLPSNHFGQIMEDGNGVLWIKIKYEDYTLYNPKDDSFDCDHHSYLQSLGLKRDTEGSEIIIDIEHNIWVHDEKGLDYFSFASQQWKHYNINKVKRLYARNGKAFAVQEDMTLQVISLKDGKVSTDHSLKALVTGHNADRPKLYVDNGDGIWIFTNHHDCLFYKQSATSQWHEFKSGIDSPDLDVRCICDAPDGNVFIAMGHQSLCFYDRKTKTIHQQDSEQTKLPKGSINFVFTYGDAIYVTYENNGLAITKQPLPGFLNPYIHNPELAKINNMNSTSLLLDKEGCAWAGTDGDGIYIVQNNTGIIRHFTLEDRLNVVVSLFLDSKNRIWVTTYGDGIYIFDNAMATPLHIKKGERGLKDCNVWCVKEDKEKNIWIGCLTEGLQKWDEDTQSFLPPALPKISVLDIGVAPDELLVLATPDGHIDFYPKTGKTQKCSFETRMMLELNIKDKSINRIFFDSRGWMWEGGNCGIIVKSKKSEKYVRLGTKEGLCNNVIHGITEDHQHNIWVITEHGMSRIIIKKNSSEPQIEELNIQNFTIFNGLKSDNFNMGSITRCGDFIFAGTPEGICPIQADKIPYNFSRGKVQITELQIGTDSLCAAVDTTKTYKIDSYENSFIIRFSTLNDESALKYRYAFRLKKDEPWSYTNNPEITFSHLESGHYTLELCIDSQINDPSHITHLDIYVCPPWWRTWWAYILYIFFVVIIFYIHRNYKKTITTLKNTITERQQGFQLAIEKMQRDHMRSEIGNISDEADNCELKNRVTEIIEKNMGKNDITVEQLSRDLGMSRANLHRRMIIEIGVGPLEFIRLARLNKAKKLLKTTQLNITEIAYAVGFSSPKSFGRYFKEEFGVTPSQFRENSHNQTS